MDGLDDLAAVADHVRPVGHRPADGEELPVGLLVYRHEVTLADVRVRLGDARAHDVGAVGDERYRSGVDGHDVFLRGVGVCTLDGEERFRSGGVAASVRGPLGVALDVEHERVAVDEDDVPVAVRELDLLEAAGVDLDPEVGRECVRDGADLVRAEMVAGFDLHTSQ